jgi:dipeptidyl aminopeptidase/acylaminoacyl peptidase
MRKSTLPLLAILFAFHATPAGNFALTVDNIMRGPGLYGYEPSQARWSGDGERLYFQWKQASDPPVKDPDTYVVNRDGSALRKISEAEAKLAPPASGATTPDKKRTVYSRDGDIFFYDATSGQTRQITKTADAETDPHFTHDGRRVAFTRANNLYMMSLDTGVLEELTDIRLAGANPPPAQTVAGEEDEVAAVSVA